MCKDLAQHAKQMVVAAVEGYSSSQWTQRTNNKHAPAGEAVDVEAELSRTAGSSADSKFAHAHAEYVVRMG